MDDSLGIAVVEEEVKFPFIPLSNYIVIDVVQKENGKIVIPDTVNPPAHLLVNMVIAVSEEKEKDGTPMVRNIKIGDSVLLSPNVRHTGSEIKIQGKFYVVCRETDVIGTLQDGWNEGNEESKILTPKLELIN